MISASIAETHRFGRVRRNGYDPAEVDAVVARLVDALRRNDERITTLTEKIDDADASADAIRKTFVAAESTRDEIIEDARTEASTITESANTEATELVEIVERLQSEVATSRDRMLTSVFHDAEIRMRHLEQQAAQRSVDAEWAVHEAIEVRNRAVSEAEADAAIKVRAASERADALMARIDAMSQAARQLEEAATSLAESAQQGAQVINISAIDHINQIGDNLVEPSTESDAVIILDREPHLEIARSADVPDGMPQEHDAHKSRYQRSTGVPLRERIKIARMSG